MNVKLFLKNWKEIENTILFKTNYSKISLNIMDILLGALPIKSIKKQDLCTINLLILIGKLVISKGKYGKVSNFYVHSGKQTCHAQVMPKLKHFFFYKTKEGKKRKGKRNKIKK